MRREITGPSGRIKGAAAVLVLAFAGSLPALPSAGPAPTPRTHLDEAPPGVDLGRVPSTGELAERSRRPAGGFRSAGVYGPAGAPPIACIGDGQDGVRVQAIYARASNVPDRFAEVAPLIAQYAADADYQINVSAGMTGSGRRVRYATKPDCTLDIVRATLTSAGDNTFSASRSELRAMGFNRSDRKYLVWVDAAVGICGIAELYGDDRASASNWNNSGNMFARVDAPCWGYAEAHELLHTIGAVQDSAPHSTGAGHCTDERDTMCYSDGSGLPMTTVCSTLPSWTVDCGLNDYFNTDPAAGSYLDTHWNSANSIYLEGAEPLPAPPGISLSAPSSFRPGTPVTVKATAVVPEGRAFTIGWTTTKPGCAFTAKTGASSVFWCAANATGSGQITATVVDALGMSAAVSKTFTLKVPAKRRDVIAGVSRSAAKVKKGTKVTLIGRAIDAITHRPVAGLRVAVYYRKAGTKVWKKITTKTTNVSGAFGLGVKPRKTTFYRIKTLKTPTWAPDKSTPKKIRVI